MAVSGHASGSAVVGVTCATTILAVVIVLLRLYTRIWVVEKAGIDDICISLAAVLSIVVTVTMCEQVRYGMGRHFSTLTPGDKVESSKWFWASVWNYYFALCLTKISILFQYLRVFPHRGFRIACYSLMAAIIAYSLGTGFAAMFACVPVARFWDRTIEGSCVNDTAVWFSNTSLNMVTDIVTAVLPLPIIKSLRLPKRQKYALMAVFGLGGFSCVVSMLRIQSLYVVSHTDDLSWNNPLAAIWSSVELNVGIICSCLPTLKGLISRIFPTLFASHPSNSYVTYQGGEVRGHRLSVRHPAQPDLPGDNWRPNGYPGLDVGRLGQDKAIPRVSAVGVQDEGRSISGNSGPNGPHWTSPSEAESITLKPAQTFAQMV